MSGPGLMAIIVSSSASQMHAQSLLGDLVYVELLHVGDHLEVGATAAVIESVKAASDIYSPVTGKVIEVNTTLNDKPETINEDHYGDGWIMVIEMTDPDQIDDLLCPEDYIDLVENDAQ